MAMTTAIATASRGCCPVCRESFPLNEDGWYSCPDCQWDWQVEVDLKGYAQLICRQPAQLVVDLRSRAVLGLMGFKPPPGGGQ